MCNFVVLFDSLLYTEDYKDWQLIIWSVGVFWYT